MQNVGNSFSLPFKTQGWAGTLALMGLISLIPIVGTIAVIGWTLALLDNYRAGRTDLPPPGFQYIGRGINLFLVVLVYGLVLVMVLVVPFFVILGGTIAASSGSNGLLTGEGTGAGATLFTSGFFAYFGVIQLLLLVLYLFYPAVIVATERGGISGGLNPVNVYRIASTNWKNSLIAGLMVYVALFLGSLGIYACCVGLIFTLPYGYAVVAGVVRFYEAEFERAPGTGSAPPPHSPPPPPYAPPPPPA